MNLIEYRHRGCSRSELQYVIRNNLQSINRYGRYHSHQDASWVLRNKANYKTLGKLIGACYRRGDVRDAIAGVNEYGHNLSFNDLCGVFHTLFREGVMFCNDCDTFVLYDDTHNVNDDYRVCEECVDNYYYSESRGYYVDEEDYDRENQDEDELIIGLYHSSRHKLSRIPSKYDARHPRVLLGLELEVEVDDDLSRVGKASDVLSALETYSAPNEGAYYYAFCESDRSLNHGFEIVTAWTGLDVHQQQLKRLEDVKHGLKSHNTKTCGLHVHICKSDMTTLHASKLILFINDENNRELVYALARRNSSGFCKLKDKKSDKSWIKDLRHYSSKQSKLRNLNSDRYEALNFQNDKTIEFRLFKGSLKYETIMACLEFTYASWFFTRSASVNELTTANFLAFICRPENRPDTRHLRAYLRNKGFSIPEVAKVIPVNFQRSLKKVA